MRITEEERQTLLADAREAIAAELEGRTPAYRRDSETSARSDALSLPCGAFVTLHLGGSLRGCIGRMTSQEALEKTVRAMARSAAFHDPRFPPLSLPELPKCRIEISALSPMSICSDPRSVRVGVHGLCLVRGGRSGVLLPQVPVEQGWDLDAYLDYLCVKAGLPPRSYDAPDAKLYTFTATVFAEDSP
ncbi:MAG: AmmeMemoRadiSam system protein A [Spirochaetaceae bacterium]|jgi:AmmeMemoRadiSam system protein A|nr:AmmeMemoRadiSam system protein A [Spirochaetaceae bacterium]